MTTTDDSTTPHLEQQDLLALIDQDHTDHEHGGELPIAPPLARPPVTVIRSARRRRTLNARLVDGVIQVRIPAHLSAAQEEREVETLVERLLRKLRGDSVDLSERARRLADRYDLPRPTRIRFVDNQQSRWGSCSPSGGDIRLSSKLAAFPAWVLDYVIVHELAHLLELNHSPTFHALVARYPRAERAKGYLIAKADGC